MSSSLTWIDHDPEARERSMRILALFQEKESRDELGLGAIRDSFSDALFPGTSTIQTRLRYMLFVPWIYQHLEKKRVPAFKFAEKARIMELALTNYLMKESDHDGVFGRIAGKGLKRLPSSVYWSGLGAWGIRFRDLSQDEYHRYIDRIYHQRDAARTRQEKDDAPDASTITWHLRLPDPPEGFPDNIKKLSFSLEPEEAGFLQDQILKNQKESLLTHLARNCTPVECDFPWQHPDMKNFSDEQKGLLKYAQFFSTVMHGAAYLYNLMLAEISDREELLEEHRENLASWKKRLSTVDFPDNSLEELWALTMGRGHTITRRAQEFVTEWVRRARETGGYVADDSESRQLVRLREQLLKGTRSRFVNAQARDQWGGYAGTIQMAYRWSNVKTFLRDLNEGLNGGHHAES